MDWKLVSALVTGCPLPPYPKMAIQGSKPKPVKDQFFYKETASFECDL